MCRAGKWLRFSRRATEGQILCFFLGSPRCLISHRFRTTTDSSPFPIGGGSESVGAMERRCLGSDKGMRTEESRIAFPGLLLPSPVGIGFTQFTADDWEGVLGRWPRFPALFDFPPIQDDHRFFSISNRWGRFFQSAFCGAGGAFPLDGRVWEDAGAQRDSPVPWGWESRGTGCCAAAKRSPKGEGAGVPPTPSCGSVLISRILCPRRPSAPGCDHLSVRLNDQPAPARAVVRLLPGAIHPLRDLRPGGPFLLFCLAPHEVCRAPFLAVGAVGSYPAVSPLDRKSVV
jgi:hypothetical protein